MLGNVVMVAIGGALGAVLRYLAGMGIYRLTGPGFPMGVLSVNILGSFAMGLFVVLAADRGWAHLSPLVMTGILGGFTTFSAFSLEAVTLWERGAIGAAALYVALSVGLSVAGLVLGVWLARGWVS